MFRISVSQRVDLALREYWSQKNPHILKSKPFTLQRRELRFRGLSVWSPVAQRGPKFVSSPPARGPSSASPGMSHVTAHASYGDATGRTPDQILVKILTLNLNIQKQQNRSRLMDSLQAK